MVGDSLLRPLPRVGAVVSSVRLAMGLELEEFALVVLPHIGVLQELLHETLEFG